MKKLFIILAFFLSVQLSNAQWVLKYYTLSNEIIRVASSPDSNTYWFITNFDRMYRTRDGGTVWNYVPHNGTAFVPSGLFVVNRDTAFKTSAGTVFRTADGGTQWDIVFSHTGSEIPVVWMKDNITGVISYNGQLHKTTDCGITWNSSIITQPPLPVVNSSGKGTVYGYGNNLWVALNGSGISYSSDFGISWILPANSGLTFSGPSNIFFGSPVFGISVKRNSSFVYVTRDGGNNWIASDNSLGLNEDAAVINSHCWYIPDPFDHNYIKYSADSGASWTIQLTDPGGFSVLDKSRKGSTLWAGTTLGKVYKYNDNISTSVSESFQNPPAFSLFQNYPNPFNPSTLIFYELNTNSSVTLTVSDINGREVAELFRGNQNPGSYRYDFDASYLSAGIYFYTLKADRYAQTKKMLLIK